jgi:hypothetical protein
MAWIKRDGRSVQNEAKKSKASPPLQSVGVDYFYGSVDMKVSALCTFVHLQRPLLYAGRAAQSVGDPTAAIVDSSPFRPFALPSRVCLCLASVYFFIYLAVPAVRPSTRAHRTPTTGSIDRLIRATLCVQARNFSPPNTTVAELRKGKLQSG